jgi:hypothetical protein
MTVFILVGFEDMEHTTIIGVFATEEEAYRRAPSLASGYVSWYVSSWSVLG